MSGKPLSVVVTRRLPQSVKTRLMALCDVELRREDTQVGPDALADAMV